MGDVGGAMSCLALIPALLLGPFLSATDGLSEQARENLCAQARQESIFDPLAVSRAGARGWGQFMRPTWGDVGPQVGCPDWAEAFDAACNMAAQRRYMATLRRSGICQGGEPVERWALAFACYNAGLGWIRRERRLCAGPLHPGCDPARWFDHVERTCLRGAASCHETRVYNARIRAYGARETRDGG